MSQTEVPETPPMDADFDVPQIEVPKDYKESPPEHEDEED